MLVLLARKTGGVWESSKKRWVRKYWSKYYCLKSLQLTLAVASAGKSDRSLFLATNSCISVKNTLGWSAVVLFACEIQGGSNMTGTNCDLFTHNQSRSYLNHLVIQLFSRVYYGVRTVHKFDIRLVVTKTLKKRRPVERSWSDRDLCFWYDMHVFLWSSSQVFKKTLPTLCRWSAFFE